MSAFALIILFTTKAAYLCIKKNPKCWAIRYQKEIT